MLPDTRKQFANVSNTIFESVQTVRMKKGTYLTGRKGEFSNIYFRILGVQLGNTFQDLGRRLRRKQYADKQQCSPRDGHRNRVLACL
jgi:hypothetical protein